MTTESGTLDTTQVSVEQSTPQQPPTPAPAPPETGNKGGMPDFLSQFTSKLKDTPKQNYGSSGAANPNRSDRSSGGPAAGGSDPGTDAPGPQPIQEPVANFDPSEKIQSEAKVWVFMTDMIASRGLAMYSGDKWQDYAITTDEKNQLEAALVEYFKTMPVTPKLPPWVVLLVVVLMIYGGRIAQAHQSKKAKKGKKKQATSDQQEPAKPEKKEEPRQNVPPRKVEKPVHKIDPSKPYFGQALDAKGRIVINPVPLTKNESRKERNGQLCLNCNQNYCEPGKNACSPHCAGKLNLKKATPNG